MKNYKIKYILYEIWKNINQRRRKDVVYLFILMVFSGLCDIFSIALAMPFLGILTNPEIVWNFKIIKFICSILGINQTSELAIWITILFVSASLFAAVVKVLNLWFNTRIAAKIGVDLSTKGWNKVLNSSYISIKKRNSSDIFVGLINDANNTVLIIKDALSIASASILAFSIITTLCIINYKICFLAILFLGFGYLILISSVKKTLAKNSQIMAKGRVSQISILKESLGSIRNLILDNLKDKSIKDFKNTTYLVNTKRSINLFIAQCPRYFFEAFGLIFIALTGYLITNRLSYNGGIAILGTFTLGCQKLLPTIQLIYSSWAQIKSRTESVVRLIEIINKTIIEKEYLTTTKKIILKKDLILKGVNFRYEDDEAWILKDININISKGEKVAFIGPSGSGKSTLIDIIMGLIKVNFGSIKVDGLEISGDNNMHLLKGWREGISHVPQEIYLTDSSIKQNIAFGIESEKINYKLVKESAKNAAIDKFIENLPYKYDTYAGERGIRFSGGQRQRIGIARALYKESNIIIFDEATSSLDNETEDTVMNAIDNLGSEITVIVIAHRLRSVANCDKIYRLENGCLKEEKTII